MEIKEFNVSVPWGHIAVKTWGDESNEPIILLHGGKDNAGSFDRLIPLLPPSFYYITWDQPSHGRSSYFPEHFPVYCTNLILAIKLLTKHFHKESYIFIGHSYGAALARLYSVCYPQTVKKLILIEGLSCFFIQPENFKDALLIPIEVSLKASLNKKRPEVTYDEALTVVRKIRLNGEMLSVEEATPLLDRAIRPVGNGKYVFTQDPRLKATINPLHDSRYSLEIFKLYPLDCPVLVILANKSVTPVLEQHVLLKEIKKWKQAQIEHVDGDHDVHIRHPERIARILETFLIQRKNNL